MTNRLALMSLVAAAELVCLDAAQAAPRDKRQPQRQLSWSACQRDARQLVQLLELSHPDPYGPLGGKVAFKRRANALLASLPRKGVTAAELGELLQSFLAGLKDGHTRLQTQSWSWQANDALPVLFDVSDRGLHVAGSDLEALESTRGLRLERVNGVAVTELESRLARRVAFENAYHARAMLRRAVVSPRLLAQLLPKLGPRQGISYDLISSAGVRSSRKLAAASTAGKKPSEWRAPPARWDRLVASDEPFYFRFLDRESIAYFRVATVMNREGYEMAYRYRWGSPKAMLERHYQRIGRPMPDDLETAIQGVPSFLEPAERLLGEMKRRKTKHLIVDLRGNGGGVTPTVQPFLYQLFGDAYYGHRFPGKFVTVISQLYLDKFKTTLEAQRQARRDPTLQLGDYVFAEEKHESAATKRNRQLAEYKQKKMSFAARLERLRGQPIYTPAAIVVLCDADTFSAAFHFMYYLRELGATVVGVPSSQAPNTPMEMTEFVLPESGLRGSISNSAQIFLPDEPGAQVLAPDFPLSYELLAKYRFEENAAAHYAFDLLLAGKIAARAGRPRPARR
jgi:hypothetical protein